MAKAVYAVVDDNQLESKICESTLKLDIDLFSIKNINDLNETIKKRIPRIIIIDLESQNIPVETVINIVRSTNRLKYVFIFGLIPNVDTKSMSKFVASKCNMVVSKRKFLREIDHLIKRNL